MATVHGIRKGLSVYYIEHNDLEWKIVELENGAYEVFFYDEGSKDFLGRTYNGHYKSYSICESVGKGIQYIEDQDLKKV